MANRSQPIRQPEQLVPGRDFTPQQAHQPFDRTYAILRKLQDEKVTVTSNTLAALTDVSVPAPVDGQVLEYVAADSQWEAVTIGSGTTTTADLEANRPAGVQGDLFLPTDGFQIERKGASTWSPWGPIFPFTPPDPASFSWVNQGAGANAGVLTTANGGMTIRAKGKITSHARCQVYTAPATPYSVTAYFRCTPMVGGTAGARAGLLFRDSVGGKMVTMGFDTGVVFFTKWNGADTGINSNYNPGGTFMVGDLWFRMTDDGTDFLFAISTDGQNFMQVLNQPRHDWLAAGPDQIGFFADSAVSSAGVDFDTVFITLLHWKVV